MLVELSEIMSPAELYRTRSLELLLFAPCGSDCTHPVLDLKCARCPTVAPVCKLYVYLDLRGAEAIHIPLCAPLRRGSLGAEGACRCDTFGV